jgi:hypothetical protein
MVEKALTLFHRTLQAAVGQIFTTKPAGYQDRR